MPKVAPTPHSNPSLSDTPTIEELTLPPWVAIVADRVKTMRYGVVQIVVHDSKVVQVERTERTRFDVPGAASGH